MEKENIALSGGGGNGLSYFQLWKEIENKDLHFGTFSGSSAGVVMGNLIMSGIPSDKGKELLKKIQGDEYLDYNKAISKAKWYKKPFMILKWIVVLRRKFFKSCKELLQTSFPDWNVVNVRCEKAYYSFVLYRDVIKFFGKKIVEELKKRNLVDCIKEKDIDVKKMFESIPVYYNTDNGIYKYDYKRDVFGKISDSVTEPWKAVLMAFNNPLFPRISVKIGWRHYDTFDGGLIDNFASLAQRNGYRSIACINYSSGESPSNICLDINKLDSKHYLKPLKNYELLEFTDENIEKEYKRKASNIFKDKV
jgi:hypothetical protein